VKYYRNDNFLKRLGKRVRELRRARNLTQSDVAFEMDLPISQIGRIERGDANFSVSYLPDLAKVLKVKTTDLLDF
jgi:transcriptional regulator with XRE-family HTH domain